MATKKNKEIEATLKQVWGLKLGDVVLLHKDGSFVKCWIDDCNYEFCKSCSKKHDKNPKDINVCDNCTTGLDYEIIPSDKKKPVVSVLQTTELVLKNSDFIFYLGRYHDVEEIRAIKFKVSGLWKVT